VLAVTHPSPDVFLSACGSSEPLRVGVGQRDGLASETWTFPRPFLVIGRRPESDLVLDHWQVSRRHTYLQLIDGRYYCVDLGSRTGTHGGDATERSGWLEPGRTIQIGPFSVRPEWPDPAERPEGSLPGVTWEVPGRAIGPSTWRMDRHLVLIGRSSSCKIRIVEPDVSKFHCAAVLTVMGVWAVDLLGQNGIFVNDRKVRCARLEDGDELRIGRHTLRARYDDPPPPLPGPESASPSRTQGSLTTVVPPALFPIPGPVGGDLLARLMPPPPTPTPPGQDLAAIVQKSGGVVDPSVNLLVHQFGMMQQQMFNQFHQTMMMMFEGFAALQREQSAALREEFERVRELSKEIEALRAETARLADAAARPRPATNGHSRPPAPGPLGQPRPIGQDEPIRRPSLPPPDPGADIHAQLCLRLSTIETERQNRWQKILGMMSSRS
jgi:pSer/pThr/pTyr-binding forkhead associated (FHA) protein